MELFGTILGYLFALGIGLGCGSYATMPYYRLYHKEPCAGKWLGRRSHCTHCGTKLRTRDLIPVFNWLLHRGACYFCKAKISPVYFFIELSCTCASLLLWWRFGLDMHVYYILGLILFTCLIIITATDYSYHYVPDAILLTMIITGALLQPPEQFDWMAITFCYSAIIFMCFSQWYAKRYQPIKSYRYMKYMVVASVFFPGAEYLLFLALIIPGLLLVLVLGKLCKWQTPYPYAGAISLSYALLFLDTVRSL